MKIVFGICMGLLWIPSPGAPGGIVGVRFVAKAEDGAMRAPSRLSRVLATAGGGCIDQRPYRYRRRCRGRPSAGDGAHGGRYAGTPQPASGSLLR
ncbi:hypothetical protein E6C76_00890 [Pseudothauera nasutitermitis]|uniref:Uncharacterized protein n=1 Tax=Pseudothauera nasutitermitis TaxID=2565930 RepID=A0A4S4B2Y7_9RHOO|nr:hypothetical protein [Pseudothauera nasutitermitis]THF66982.1 hypothetical protein E6C76_00890 [Pseudothauera nasutitermitis]